MAKVTQVNNLDPGSVARSNWNEAMRTAETDLTITGDGTIPSPLAIVVDNSPGLTSNSTIIGPSVAALKLWAQSLVTQTERARAYTLGSRINVGTNYIGGHYFFQDSSEVLTQAAPNYFYGDLLTAYASYAGVVSGGVGTTDGTFLTLTVNGISIDDNGVRTPGDSEVLIVDCLTAGTNDYFQSSKRWLGQVEFVLSSDGANFSYEFNLGYVWYEHFSDQDVAVQKLEATGVGNKNGSVISIDLLHHRYTGWTFAATNFIPGSSPDIVSMAADYAPDNITQNNEPFTYHREGLAYPILGASGEGVIIRFITDDVDPADHINFTLTYNLLP